MIASAREKAQQKHNQPKVDPHYSCSFMTSFLKGFLLGLMVLIVGGYGVFRLMYWNKIFPGVYLLGSDVGGSRVEEGVYFGRDQLQEYLATFPDLILKHKGDGWKLNLTELGMGVDESKLKSELISYGRRGSIKTQAQEQWKVFTKSTNIPLPLTYHEKVLADFVSTASAQIQNPLIPASVYKGTTYNRETSSFIYVERGQAGESVQTGKTIENIISSIQNLNPPIHTLSTITKSPSHSRDDLDKSIDWAKKLVNKNLTLTHTHPTTKATEDWALTGSDLLSFLSISERIDQDALLAYAKSTTETINSPAQNAVFGYNEKLSKVEAFKPGIPGVQVQVDVLAMMMSETIEKMANEKEVKPVEVPTTQTQPTIGTGEVNDLGISSLIGRGESTYYHSSASRKYNVEYAAALLNGVLIPPGETFSFNGVIGEISLATGFKQALIIKDGETILGDGGGVCQDSTTLFRAALNAGLPITGWRNHSFRVGYYEQNSKPGFDATIFSPLPDLTFINNTPGHILIQTTAENMKLVYELYGTNDGRVATISNYTQWDAAPPPPDLYKDDSTLAVGVVKKVESAVPGLKTKFDYSVTRDGEVLFEKTFLSVYRPWQAVYLRGTKPI